MRLLRHPSILLSTVLLAACPDKENDSTSMTGTTTDASTGGTSSTSSSTTDQPTTSGTTTSGTSTSGTTGTPPGGACGAFVASKTAALTSLCGCLVEQMQFPDVETCLMLVADPPEIDQCTCDVLADFPAVDPFLTCQTKVQDDLTKCLSGISCTDMAAFDGCFEAAGNASDLCPESDKQADGAIELQCHDGMAFMCKSGEQIPQSYTCDNEMDCPDSSDEDKALCIFTCMNGEEVPIYTKCDGSPDCMDMSDEPPECYFMCMDGEQILQQFVCDGFDDCMDASDEIGDCKFMCTSGEQIPKSWKCDGEPDCRDGSDEANCP